MRSIEVVNNSAEAMSINTNSADGSLYLAQKVTPYARLFVVIEIKKLQTIQDKLFEAIFNDSEEEIKRAIQAGANVNIAKDGASLLTWAVSLHRIKAAKCLIENGAV